MATIGAPQERVVVAPSVREMRVALLDQGITAPVDHRMHRRETLLDGPLLLVGHDQVTQRVHQGVGARRRRGAILR